LERDPGRPLLHIIYSLHDPALAVLYSLFPDPEASLLAGIFLGVDSGLPPEVQQAFRDTGTSHIIAISGLTNIISIILGIYQSRKNAFW